MSSFVHLHVHSEYSLLDGAIRLQQLASKTAELGMPAVALTDHHGLYGVVNFYQKALTAGVKPIVGCEMCVSSASSLYGYYEENTLPHLVLLARTMEGYRNLMQLVTLGSCEGQNHTPLVNNEKLKSHADGITALSGCMAGEIPRLILQDQLEEAENIATFYASVFGDNYFYLEMQDHGLPGQGKINEGLAEISQKRGIPLVATNNAHYLEKEDNKAHDVLLCLKEGKVINDKESVSYNSCELYLKSPSEMQEIFNNYSEALKNTMEIAEDCSLNLEVSSPSVIGINLPSEQTEIEFLRQICTQGLSWRYKWANNSLQKRLDYELKIIEQMDCAGYFLTLWDIVRYAREKDIQIGPGRGSAVGSLVNYCLGITEIDPIKHDLVFECFFNPTLVNMPDVTIDINGKRRDEVIEYMEKKYGEDRVAHIIHFGVMRSRMTVKAVGRALNVPTANLEHIIELIPNEPGVTIRKALEISPELQSYYENEENRELLDISLALEGLPRNAVAQGKGVVVAGEPLVKHVPLQKSNTGNKVAQFPEQKLKDMGLVKFDIQSLKFLKYIEEALKNIKHRRGKQININMISLDDKNTYDYLVGEETEGIFLLEKEDIKNFLRELKPNNFSELTAAVALCRPGVYDQTADFTKIKYRSFSLKNIPDDVVKILRETYGVIIFQEQIMQIASEIAGFHLRQAHLMQRALSSNHSEELGHYRKQFIKGASAKGCTPEEGENTFQYLKIHAPYVYNKSQATAYAFLIYQTAYIKANYPEEYKAALSV